MSLKPCGTAAHKRSWKGEICPGHQLTQKCLERTIAPLICTLLLYAGQENLKYL